MPQTELRQQTLVPRSPGLKSKVKARWARCPGRAPHSPTALTAQWNRGRRRLTSRATPSFGARSQTGPVPPSEARGGDPDPTCTLGWGHRPRVHMKLEKISSQIACEIVPYEAGIISLFLDSSLGERRCPRKTRSMTWKDPRACETWRPVSDCGPVSDWPPDLGGRACAILSHQVRGKSPQQLQGTNPGVLRTGPRRALRSAPALKGVAMGT